MPYSPSSGTGLDHLLELRQLAGTAPQLNRAVAHHRDAGRVVAAVFEPSEAVDQNGYELFRADVADDSAHDALYFLFFSTQPGLLACLPLPIARAPGGTSSVMDEPAAT